MRLSISLVLALALSSAACDSDQHVSITPDSHQLAVGELVTFQVKLAEGELGVIQAASSDPKVLVVELVHEEPSLTEAAVTVRSVAPGTAELSIWDDEFTATRTIQVRQPDPAP